MNFNTRKGHYLAMLCSFFRFVSCFLTVWGHGFWILFLLNHPLLRVSLFSKHQFPLNEPIRLPKSKLQTTSDFYKNSITFHYIEQLSQVLYFFTICIKKTFFSGIRVKYIRVKMRIHYVWQLN